jgi:hypothetical protein
MATMKCGNQNPAPGEISSASGVIHRRGKFRAPIFFGPKKFQKFQRTFWKRENNPSPSCTVPTTPPRANMDSPVVPQDHELDGAALYERLTAYNERCQERARAARVAAAVPPVLLVAGDGAPMCVDPPSR